MSMGRTFPFPVRGRRSVRLRGHDYRSGTYFITICADDRGPTFGEVAQRRVRLSPAGRVARTCWLEIPRCYPHVQVDAFVVMPDHIHGILCFTGAPGAPDRHDVLETPCRDPCRPSLAATRRRSRNALTRNATRQDGVSGSATTTNTSFATRPTFTRSGGTSSRTPSGGIGALGLTQGTKHLEAQHAAPLQIGLRLTEPNTDPSYGLITDSTSSLP
jgi:hypothetical protein